MTRKEKKPREVIGIDHSGNRRKMWIFPKNASPEELYWMLMETMWKPL